MRAGNYELWPGCFFLERRTGGGSWSALSRDNDLPVMRTRMEYAVELLEPGQSARLINWRGEVIDQREFKTENA